MINNEYIRCNKYLFPWFEALNNLIFQTNSGIKMRFSIFEVVLPLATVFAISVSGLSKEQDLGSNFEKQLILVESDLEPIGKLATQNVLPV